MTWNIADAKQQFSEVILLSPQEPRPFHNRGKRVAAVIAADDLEEFARLRAALIEDRFEDGIDAGPRVNRSGPFDDPNWNA